MRRYRKSLLSLRRSAKCAALAAAMWAADAPARADLVGLYTFDDGTANDSSGYGNHGTIVGTAPIASPFGGAVDDSGFFSFAGTTHINTPVNGNPTAKPKFTMGAWAKVPTGTPTLSRQVIAHDDGGWDRSLGLDNRGNGSGGGDVNYRWTGFNGNGPIGGTTPLAGTENQWVFVAAVYDEGSMQIRVNENTFTAPAVHGLSAQALRIAGNPCCGENWIGELDNVFFFDEALTTQQLDEIQAFGVAGIQFHGADPGNLRQRWDFEGSLDGFTNVAGTAFLNQPTFGDNPQARGGGHFTATFGSGIHGEWMVGTYENRPNSAAPAGGNQADAPTGIIETAPFVLEEEAFFEMMVGGGNHFWPQGMDPDALPAASNTGVTAVTLERMIGPNDWEMIFAESGRADETMHFIKWDATAFEGDTVRLRVYDNNTGGWGHINVDNIRYYSAVIPEPSTVVLAGMAGVALVAAGWRRRKKAEAGG
jgi:hypothetical protein